MSIAAPRTPGRVFRDRHEAGAALVGALHRLAAERPVVVGIPRGGVPVAVEVARGLHAPLDVAVVLRLCAPEDPALAIGAVGEDGVLVIDRQAVALLGLGPNELESLITHGRRELSSRQARYRPASPGADLEGRTAILVDDGIATGVTAVAAARVMRLHGAGRVVLAVPVAPVHLRAELHAELDELISLESPDPFEGIGAWYEEFAPLSDDDVVQLLARGRVRSARPPRRLGELVGLRARIATQLRAGRVDRASRVTLAHVAAELKRRVAPPDVLTARAKSSRHGKSTADKWNQ